MAVLWHCGSFKLSALNSSFWHSYFFLEAAFHQNWPLLLSYLTQLVFKCGRVLQGPISSVRSFICGIPRKALQCWTTRELGALSHIHDSSSYLGWRANFLGIHPALCRCLETKSFLGCRRMTPVQLEARPWATLEGSSCAGDVGEAPLWAGFARSLRAGQEHLQPEPQEGAVAGAWPTPLSMRPFGGLQRSSLRSWEGGWWRLEYENLLPKQTRGFGGFPGGNPAFWVGRPPPWTWEKGRFLSAVPV